jgi:hypothetical protein
MGTFGQTFPLLWGLYTPDRFDASPTLCESVTIIWSALVAPTSVKRRARRGVGDDSDSVRNGLSPMNYRAEV